MTSKTSHLAAKLNTFMPLSRAEADCLAQIQAEPLAVARGEEFVHQGDKRQSA